MRDALQHAANQIISGTVGQVIDKAGYTSIGTGLGLKVAEQTPVAQSYIASMIPPFDYRVGSGSFYTWRAVTGGKKPF